MIEKAILHYFYRLFLFVIGFYISIIIAQSLLNPDRRCGTGDIFAYLLCTTIFHTIWSIALTIEAVILHKKKEIIKRNINLVMAFIIPILFLLLFLYTSFIDNNLL